QIVPGLVMENRRRKTMGLLAHMSIRTRLLMTLILPLSVLLYFSISALVDRTTLLRETQILQGLSTVTVQVVKTGITPPLATSGRFWGAEMERLHHARRLHAQQ